MSSVDCGVWSVKWSVKSSVKGGVWSVGLSVLSTSYTRSSIQPKQ